MSTVDDLFAIIFPIHHGLKITLSGTPYNIKGITTVSRDRNHSHVTKPIIMNPSSGELRIKSARHLKINNNQNNQI